MPDYTMKLIRDQIQAIDEDSANYTEDGLTIEAQTARAPLVAELNAWMTNH